MTCQQLPTWYELWWDNGFYPGQPVCDYMFGAWPGNMTEAYYLRFWSVFGLVLAAPFYYAINFTDETRMPMVGKGLEAAWGVRGAVVGWGYA